MVSITAGLQNLSAAVLSPTSVYLTLVAPCDYRGTCGTYVDEGTSHTEYTFDEDINYAFIINQTGFGGGRASTGSVYAMTSISGMMMIMLNSYI